MITGWLEPTYFVRIPKSWDTAISMQFNCPLLPWHNGGCQEHRRQAYDQLFMTLSMGSDYKSIMTS